MTILVSGFYWQYPLRDNLDIKLFTELTFSNII